MSAYGSYGADHYGDGTYGALGIAAAATTTVQHGGKATRFKGRTLGDREIDAHVARLLEAERLRAEDEALVLLLCA